MDNVYPDYLPPPAYLDNSPAHLGNSPAHLGNSPAHLGNSPAHLGNSPAHLGTARHTWGTARRTWEQPGALDYSPASSPPQHRPGDNTEPSYDAGQQRRAGPSGRSRTVFSQEQKRLLMQRFRRQRYLGPAERSRLAITLGLDCKQVKTWYQNRRMKLKRQYPLAWRGPDINPFSDQTPGLMADMMKSHLVCYEQCGEETMGQRPLMEGPFSEFLQPPSVHPDLQTHPATPCFHFQNAPSENHLTGFFQEQLVVPETPPPPFTEPGCGVGWVVSGDAPSPYFMDQIQSRPLSPTYPPTQAERTYPPEEGASNTQGIHIQQSGWRSLQSTQCSGYMMITPLTDPHDAESPAFPPSFSHDLVG